MDGKLFLFTIHHLPLTISIYSRSNFFGLRRSAAKAACDRSFLALYVCAYGAQLSLYALVASVYVIDAVNDRLALRSKSCEYERGGSAQVGSLNARTR